jgi:preprotein translocase subunit SecG
MEVKKMFEYILLGLLLVAAVFIVVAVTLQKTSEDGISGTIMGGSETYYGKDKARQSGKVLGKWTLIVSVVFAVAVLVVYVMQPDYIQGTGDPEGWQELVKYNIFN